jgi:hypothetical protein
MVLGRADGSLCGVALMFMWWCQLKLDVSFGEPLFEFL